MFSIAGSIHNEGRVTKAGPYNHHRIVVLVFAFLMSSFAFAKENSLTEVEQAEGWKLLFNGRDMSQWRNYQKDRVNKKWIVYDGAMVITGKGAGDLITRKKHRNFDLRLEWQISVGGNSGLFILSDEETRVIYMHAPEIQFLDNERHPDNKQDNHLSGSLYDMIASPAASHRKAGEWNQLRILLEDKALTVWQNSEVTAEVTIGSEAWNDLVAQSKFKNWQGFGANDEGFIGLQDHGDQISFRNIKIKSLHE